MAKPMPCDICNEAQGRMLVTNLDTGSVFAVCPHCAPAGLRGLADTIESALAGPPGDAEQEGEQMPTPRFEDPNPPTPTDEQPPGPPDFDGGPVAAPSVPADAGTPDTPQDTPTDTPQGGTPPSQQDGPGSGTDTGVQGAVS